jgi:hypothetical protein
MTEPPDPLNATVLLEDWRALDASDRRAWWERLWLDAIALSDRYRLGLRAGWWEDSVQVEALGAFSTWTQMFDTGVYNDPQGKLNLLWQVDRLRHALRGGEHAFDPARDRAAYETHLAEIGCPAPAGNPHSNPAARSRAVDAQRRALTAELDAVTGRLAELSDREQILQTRNDETGHAGERGAQAARDLGDVKRTIEQLARRQRELRRQLDETARG